MDRVDQILEQWRQERPDLDVEPMGLIGRLKRLTDHLTERHTEVFKAHGITAASFDVLATLRRSGPPFALSPTELIDWTMVTSGTMTNRLDRLVEAGLIERRPNPKDGRSTVVALTQSGFALIDRVATEHVANQHRMMAALPPEVQARLNDDIAVWLASFEQTNS